MALTLMAMAVAGFVLPLLKKKLDTENFEAAKRIVETVVQWAENTYGEGGGVMKMNAVKDELGRRGVDASDQDIEAAVLRMHGDGYAYQDAHASIDADDVWGDEDDEDEDDEEDEMKPVG